MNYDQYLLDHPYITGAPDRVCSWCGKQINRQEGENLGLDEWVCNECLEPYEVCAYCLSWTLKEDNTDAFSIIDFKKVRVCKDHFEFDRPGMGVHLEFVRESELNKYLP